MNYNQYIVLAAVLVQPYLHFKMVFSEEANHLTPARNSELSCRLIKAGGFLDNWSIDVIKANQAGPLFLSHYKGCT